MPASERHNPGPGPRQRSLLTALYCLVNSLRLDWLSNSPRRGEGCRVMATEPQKPGYSAYRVMLQLAGVLFPDTAIPVTYFYVLQEAHLLPAGFGVRDNMS